MTDNNKYNFGDYAVVTEQTYTFNQLGGDGEKMTWTFRPVTQADVIWERAINSRAARENRPLEWPERMRYQISKCTQSFSENICKLDAYTPDNILNVVSEMPVEMLAELSAALYRFFPAWGLPIE